MAKKKKKSDRISRSSHLKWVEWNIYSGYSVKQTSEAIRALMSKHDDWGSYKTDNKIALIKEYMKKNNVEKVCV